MASQQPRPEDSAAHGWEMVIRGVETGPPEEDYRPLRLVTSRGLVHGRYYPAAKATRGAVWVGGVGGGWDTPACGLYPRLCRELQPKGIASLRVRFRDPHDLDESVLDVLAGASFLEAEGVRSLALVGHSFGGAVVIQAGAAWPAVRTVVTLATQGYGAEAAAELGPRASLLLVHGTEDHVLPAACSRLVHQAASGAKRLALIPGAGHVLDEAADEVRALVGDWVVGELKDAGAS